MTKENIADYFSLIGRPENRQETALNVDLGNLDLFFRFINERNEVFRRRFIEHKPAPWTDDPVLREYKFTNVYRELDRGTLYVLNEIIGKGTEKDVFFNILVYRIFNNINTQKEIGFLHLNGFDAGDLYGKLDGIRASERPVFTNAFMVSGAKYAGSDDKIYNMVYGVIRDDVVKNFDDYFDRIKNAKSIEEAHSVIKEITHFGDFLAYEAVIDLNYSGIIKFSEDDWVNAGPGCRKGLNHIFPDKGDYSYEELIKMLRTDQNLHFKRLGIDFKRYKGKDLSLRNMEHSLCEFSKYFRLLHLESKRTHVRLFKPSSEPLRL